MMDPSAVHNLFGIDGLDIAWYGIIIAAAIIIGVWFAIIHAKRAGYKAELIIDMMCWALPLAIVGARVYYVATDILDRPENYQTFIDYIAIWRGGIAIYGAVIGAFIGALISARIHKFPFRRLLDFGVVGLVFGQALGRWGNFFNQEAFGAAVTDKAWQWFPNAVYIEKAHKIYDVASTSWVNCAEHWHQATFFYESACNFGLFFFLWWFIGHKKKYDGEVVSLYFIGYGIARLIIEGMRTDSLWLVPGVIRISQLLSIILIAIGLVYLIYRRVTKKPNKIYEGPYQINYKKQAEGE